MKASVEDEDASQSPPSNADGARTEATTPHALVGPDVAAISLVAPTDSLYAQQWHLHGRWGSNVVGAWDRGYTGEGVRVAVYDDGIEWTHADLAGQVDQDESVKITLNGAVASYAAGGQPLLDVDNHGTAIAGVIAASRNGSGSVGVAYDARLLSIYHSYSSSTATADAEFAAAIRWSAEHADVMNNSWGYPYPFVDNFATTFGKSAAAMEYAAEAGRDGLGLIMVAAAGNEREIGGNSNYHNLQNARYVISVAANSDDAGIYGDRPAWYSSAGANILVGAPGGVSGANKGIVTTDRTGAAGYEADDYVEEFYGTSPAAAIVSGVVALILEANADLGWRDVQEILAATARLGAFSSYNGAAKWNGGGYHTGDDLGFGLVDAAAAVRLAETWIGTPQTSENESLVTGYAAPSAHLFPLATITSVIAINAAIEIERVEVALNLQHSWRGDVEVSLKSPSGFVSRLVREPLFGRDGQDHIVFTLSSTQFRGETGVGDWTLTVTDHDSRDQGYFRDWTLRLYGDAPSPDDVYVYTDEFARLVGSTQVWFEAAERSQLEDLDGGIDTLNAAIMTYDAVFDLNGGASTLSGPNWEGILWTRNLMIAPGAIEVVYAGVGDDTIVGTSRAETFYGGDGFDIASYAAATADLEIDLVAGTFSGDVGAADRLYGIEGIGGGQGSDTIRGGSANDILMGGGGVDSLYGGVGDDTYEVDSAGDLLFESIDGGVDVALGLASFTLAANVENLRLVGSAALDAVGNELDNVIDGNDGDNRIYGAGGADTLRGGKGDDTYFDIGADDVIVEIGSEGRDAIVSAESRTLTIASVESLILVGVDDLSGKGNGASNVLVGNSGANVLDGLLGSDTLYGAEHSDTLFGGESRNDDLYGGEGSDTLYGGLGGEGDLNGGAGADTMFGREYAHFWIDDVDDVIVRQGQRFGGGKTDWIAIHSPFSRTLSDGESALYLLGDEDLDGKIDSWGGTLVGNSGANMLDLSAESTERGHGGRRADGMGGDDVIVGSHLSDAADGGAGSDTIYGGAETDWISGGAGVDFLYGGAGNDVYTVDASDRVYDEHGAPGVDTVSIAGSYSLALGLENVVIGGSGDFVVEGNGQANSLVANNGHNVMYGGAGADSMHGWGGRDTLYGGLGSDEMSGGGGDDTYYVVDAGDRIIEETGGGNDTVVASADVSLPTTSSVEVILMVGDAVTKAFGGAEANTIYGSAADNYLSGGDLGADLLVGAAGDDTLESGWRSTASASTMYGGLGDDVYLARNGSDRIFERAGEGDDTIVSSGRANFANVETFILAEGAGGAVHGLEHAERLIGNAGGNSIYGGLGDDLITGGGGRDSLFGGADDDVLNADRDDGYVDGGAGVDTIHLSDQLDVLGPNVSFNAEVWYLNDGDDRFSAAGSLLRVHERVSDQTVVRADMHFSDRDGIKLRGVGAVSNLGDLNGDGFDEVATGHHSSWVVLDGRAQWPTSGVTISNSTDGVTRITNAPNLVPIGDVNGDGVDDIAVLGRPAGPIVAFGDEDFGRFTRLDALEPGEGVTLTGHGNSGRAGGDFNGDGVADLLLQSNSSAWTLVFGGDALIDPKSVIDQLSPEQGLTLDVRRPSNPYEPLSTLEGVRSVGDMNADGRDDLLAVVRSAGAYEYFLVWGRDQTTSSLTVDVNYAVRLQFSPNFSPSGLSGVAAGDFNGDGAGDIVLDGSASGGWWDGVFVVFGKSGNWDTAPDLSRPGDGHHTVYLTHTGQSTIILAADHVGDYDGDGSDDFMLNVARPISQWTSDWTTQLVFGDVNRWADGRSVAVFDSYQSNALAQVSLAGDVNGDGRDDVAFNLGGGAANILFGRGSAERTTDAARTIFGGDGADEIAGASLLDTIYGGADADRLEGGGGDDRLIGGGGDDVFEGGAGADVFVVNAGDGHDAVRDFGVGSDVVDLSSMPAVFDLARLVSWGGALFEDGNDVVVSFGEANGGGSIRLQGVSLHQIGDEDFVFAPVPLIEGSSSDDVLVGSHAANTIFGRDGADTLLGLAGADTLDGGAGADAMAGGAGNDVYVVDDVGDSVDETSAGSGGDDVVRLLISAAYSVGSGVERVVVENNAGASAYASGESDNVFAGGAGADLLSTGAGNDRLYGGLGDDELDGGAGVDTMSGGAGNDRYVVDRLGDVVIEDAGGGEADSVRVSVDGYHAPVAVERIEVVGPAGLSVWADGEADDAMYGGIGGDRLYAGAGSDFVDGGLGADSMAGGSGDDTYALDEAGDEVDETSAGSSGSDTVFLSFGGSYAVGTGVEQAVATGDAALTLTSSGAEDNRFYGGLGSDRFSGGAGADELSTGGGDDTAHGGVGDDELRGGAGVDTLFGEADADELWGGEGVDRLSGADGSDTLWGGEDGDSLDGGTGADTMAGGAGNDRYQVDSSGDVVDETSTGSDGSDTVAVSAGSWTAGAGVEWIVAGAGGLSLWAEGETENVLLGGAGVEVAWGGASWDRLKGAGGVDTLYGDAGEDTLEGGDGGDLLDGGADNDRLLGGRGNDVAYGGDGQDSLAGDEADDRLEAGAGDDRLTGAEGVDALYGGSGDDTADGGTENDVLDGGAGLDRLLGGDGVDQLYGGLDADRLYGGLGNDVLDGGVGADTMSGGAGDDLYLLDEAGDAVDESSAGSAGADNAQVRGSAATVGVGVERIQVMIATGSAVTATGTFDHTLLGGAGSDVLDAGAGNDRIAASGGADTAFGGTGIDTLTGGAGDDVLYGGAGGDVLNGEAGADAAAGGAGDDRYSVDEAGDVVDETSAGSGGRDTALVSASAWIAGEGVEFVYAQNAGGGTMGAAGVTDNFVYGVGGNDVLDAGAGNDRVFGGAGDDSLSGGEGIDSLFGGLGSDLLEGGAGIDILNGDAGADTMVGGAGNDRYYANQSDDKVDESSGEGIDTLTVTASDYAVGEGIERIYAQNLAGATIVAGSDDNFIYGQAGGDDFDGGGGNDRLYGANGNDALTGGAGNDSLFGGQGIDVLDAGDGNDILDGGVGADTMVGGTGNDRYLVNDAGDVADESGGSGTDTIQVQVADYTVGEGIEWIYSVVGTVSAPGATDNFLFGGAGKNVFFGGAGADRLFGGAGADTLAGGTGADTLTGGDGADLVRYAAGDGNDVISGFDRTQGDRVDLDGVALQQIAGNRAILSDGAVLIAQVGFVWIVADFV